MKEEQEEEEKQKEEEKNCVYISGNNLEERATFPAAETTMGCSPREPMLSLLTCWASSSNNLEPQSPDPSYSSGNKIYPVGRTRG